MNEQLPSNQCCSHCNNQGWKPTPINLEWYFCPYCGRGLKPMPCEHYPETGDHAMLGNVEWIEPLVELVSGREHSIRVRCPKCNTKGHIWQRTWWAIDEWNQWMMGRGVDMPDESDTSEAEQAIELKKQELVARLKAEEQL